MSSWFGLPSLLASTNDESSEGSQDDTTPAHSRRAHSGVAFTALKCPRGSGLKNSCELPFGFVWTPMAASGDSQKMPIIECSNGSLPPVLCLACLAYMNPFVEFDEETGTWSCPLCGHENALPGKEALEGSQIMTALTSTCVEYRQMVSKPEPYEEEKKYDGHYGNCNEDEEDSCTYLLVVDENLSPKDGQAIAPAMEAILKEQRSSSNPEDAYAKIRIGLIVFGKNISIYQLGLSGLASADIYQPGEFDGDDDDDDEFDNNMERRSYIAEVQSGDFTSLRNSLSSIFGVAVDENDVASTSQTQTSRLAMLKKKRAARLRKEENSNDDNTNKAAKSPWVKRREESPSGYPKRCTGKALQCAFDLVSASTSTSKSSRTSRIIMFTNGCPNSGDGSVVNPKDCLVKSKNKKGKRATHSNVDTNMLQKAVEYFDKMANMAVSFGIGVDVICCGVAELALPVYQAMVEPSGGYVLPLVTLDTPQLKQDLKFILGNTYMSRSMGIPEDIGGMDGAESLLDIRSDIFVTPTQLCGSATILTGLNSEMNDTEKLAVEEGFRLALEKGFSISDLPSEKAMDLSMTRIQMGRVDPLNTVTVLLEVNDTIGEEDDYAFFQLVSRYISRNGGAEITRVYSFKLLIAEDVNDFLGSVDDEAMSVVLAKLAVHRSLHGREETEHTRDLTAAGNANTQEELAYDTQLDLDATIQRISGAFRLHNLEKRSDSVELRSREGISQSSLDFAFPPQLKETLNRLYHLRRGHLISPGPMRSMDDRAESRALFLRFPVENCLQMIRPSIWSTGSFGVSSGWDTMLPFPAETLALWDDSIIAGDFYDSLFVWSGANCTAGRYDGIREKFKTHLLEISKNRFPMPELLEINDGDSMSRRFTPRLAPSHADPIDNQIANFPLLSTLKTGALDDLRSKFKFYDAKSDESFRTWFWSVVSASNISRMEGMSLCE